MDEPGDFDALLFIDTPRCLKKLNHVLLGDIAALLLAAGVTATSQQNWDFEKMNPFNIVKRA